MNNHFNRQFTFIHTEEQNDFAVDIFQDNDTEKYFFDYEYGKHFDTLDEVVEDAKKLLSFYNTTTTS